MSSFSYQAPDDLSELLALLSEAHQNGHRSQILAGGTDLLVQMKTLDLAPRLLVDIKKVPEVNSINIGDNRIYIGAAVPAYKLTRHPVLKQLLPGVIESVYLIGSSQIQGRATLGGNLCNASPAGDSIPALISTGASCLIDGPDGERQIPAEDFVVGVGQNALVPGEVLLGLIWEHPQGRTASAYLRFTPRTEMDIAVVGAGVSLTLDESGLCTSARVSLGAIAPTALYVPEIAEVLVGSRLDEAALEAAGNIAGKAGSPITDKRGTVAFRHKIAAVLTRRAATIACQRAEVLQAG